MSKKSKLAFAAKKCRPIKSYFATKIPTTPDDSRNPTPNRNCACAVDDVVDAIADGGFKVSLFSDRRHTSADDYDEGARPPRQVDTSSLITTSNWGGSDVKSYSTFSAGENTNANATKITPATVPIVEAAFALEGLTCATCVGAVRRAVISLGPDSGLDVGSVDVRLLPDTTLTARYDGGRLGLDDAIASSIEDVGFGATLTSRRDVSADDNRSRWSAEDGGKSPSDKVGDALSDAFDWPDNATDYMNGRNFATIVARQSCRLVCMKKCSTACGGTYANGCKVMHCQPFTTKEAIFKAGVSLIACKVWAKRGIPV